MARDGGLVGRLQEAFEQRTGLALEKAQRVELLEASDQERRALERELDRLAYHTLDYFSGTPQDVKAQERRKMAQKARVVWMNDPQAGASVDLLNDFVFGRGMPRPKCHDEEVQEVVDEAWDDPDNQLILTTYAAQMALGTDLALQSNVFLLVFDDGDDGKVKLGLLDHDCVEAVVRDPDNRLKILWYVAREKRVEWDFENDRAKPPALSDLAQDGGKPRVFYYEHWSNVENKEEQGEPFEKPPTAKMGEGRVYHIAVNRTTEMWAGVPTMQRIIRWFTAYNDFMSARVDMAQAAAAFIMKRKVKGTPNQLSKMATQALSRRSDLSAASYVDDSGELLRGPRPASVLQENEGVSHEDFNINTNAGNAMQDGQMLRSQISAATHFPQHYLGDAGSANLATATSMELPVLKHIEGRQELIESMVRFFIDRVIERAIDTGRISKEKPNDEKDALDDAPAESPYEGQPPELALDQAHEDQHDDEEVVERDLGYDFSLPSPLKRMMTDLVTSIMNLAKTFDPNGTNLELSRILLSVALGEGLELEDPAKAVEMIFPPGYEDPAMKAMMAGGMPGAPGQPPPGQPGEDGATNPFGPGPGGNPYGAPMASRPPEQAMQQAAVNGDELDAMREVTGRVLDRLDGE